MKTVCVYISCCVILTITDQYQKSCTYRQPYCTCCYVQFVQNTLEYAAVGVSRVYLSPKVSRLDVKTNLFREQSYMFEQLWHSLASTHLLQLDQKVLRALLDYAFPFIN